MWYSAEALFRCNVQGESKDVLYERQIFLIEVTGGKQKASRKAKKMALGFENVYKNSDGNDVSWRLVKVLEVQDLCEKEIYDGVEVFSRLIWENEVPEKLRKKFTISRKKKRRKK